MMSLKTWLEHIIRKEIMKSFDFDLIRSLSMDSPVTEQNFLKSTPDEIIEKVYSKVLEDVQKESRNNFAAGLPCDERCLRKNVHSVREYCGADF